MANGWKIFAIILLILLILETSIIGFLFYIGSNEIKKETTCSNLICAGDKYDAYFYDSYLSTCYCYKDDELVHTALI